MTTKRAPKAEKKPKSAASAKRTSTKAGKAAKQLAEQNQQESWLKKIQEPQKKPKKYAFDGIYAVEDLIAHDSFGVGLVTLLVFPDKMEVFFESGSKLLKSGKFA